MNEEEASLIKAAQQDPQAFGRLFDAHYKPIFNFCLKRLGHVQSAEDVTSEVFFKVLDNLKKYQDRGLPFGAWLFRIANNEVYNYLRKIKFQTESLEGLQENSGFDPAAEGNAATAIFEQELQDQRFANYRVVNKIILELPQKYQEVLSLRFFEHKQLSEIAAILNKSEGTVKSLLSRGLQKIRDCILKNNFALQPLQQSEVVIDREAI